MDWSIWTIRLIFVQLYLRVFSPDDGMNGNFVIMIKYFLHTSTATLFFYYNIIIIIINRSSGTFSPRYTSPSHPPTHSLTHLSPTTPLSRTRKLRHCESKITLKGLLNFLIFLIVWCFMFLGYWIQLGRSFSYGGYDFSSHCFFFIVFEIVKEKKIIDLCCCYLIWVLDLWLSAVIWTIILEGFFLFFLWKAYFLVNG